MTFGPGTYGLAAIAGTLSTLSPCVLPLVPVLIASAVNAHRWGALALGAGLALAYAVVGISIAALGGSLGLDPDTLRTVGGFALLAFGLLLVVPKLQELFARTTGALSNSGNSLLARVTIDGLAGQFLVGALLGVVWSPCVGPTLGAATTLASQGRNLSQIALLMLVFGAAAAAPLVILGSLSRHSMMRIRGRLLNTSQHGKRIFGAILLGLGGLIVTGWDKPLETWILNHTPDWLTLITTKF